jgi:hypothetical protein
LHFDHHELSATWEGPDKNIDYVVRVSFESIEAVHTYRSHPYNMTAIDDLLAVAD